MLLLTICDSGDACAYVDACLGFTLANNLVGFCGGFRED